MKCPVCLDVLLDSVELDETFPYPGSSFWRCRDCRRVGIVSDAQA